MNSFPPEVRLSVLDRSRIRAGHDAAAALRDTVALAVRAEEWGFHRFWVSEHHGVPGVAGSAPTVLAAAIAAATGRIRVGTGGVMLPNHRPLVVAEQFGVLESLFPGRIDMGLGRSVGFTDGVRTALGVGKDDADNFAESLAELLAWFTDGSPQGVHARPAEGLRVPPFVLAMGHGAGIAAEAGLPLVIGDLRDREKLLRGVSAYRSAFRPSAWAERPYVVIAGTVAVADDRESARRLLLPEAWAAAHARSRGSFPALSPVEEIEGLVMSARERELFEGQLTGQVHGDEADVARQLGEIVTASGADEVLVTTSTYEREELYDSLGRLARLAGLPARRGS